MRDKPIRLLEIGIENGFSVKIWLEYFQDATVYGVDILPKPNFDDDRFVFEQGDQSDIGFWVKFLDCHDGPFDIVIDDGGHKSGGIITAFENLFPFVNSGGYYIIEDLSTAYMPGYQDGWQNQMEFVSSLLHDINSQLKYRPPHWEKLEFSNTTTNERNIEWLQFSEELAIIKKK